MTNTEIADVAESIGHVFLIPGTWTRGASARCIYGGPALPASPHACQWCLFGAADAVVNSTDELDIWVRRFRKWLGVAKDCSLSRWNDAPDQTAENIANELFNFADALRAGLST